MSATRTLAIIYYTADVFTPDDSDTNVYGEATEPGYGMTMISGWWDAAWSLFDVFPDKDDVRPDTIEDDDERLTEGWTLDDLIIQDVTARLGSLDSFEDGTAYAADPIENYKTGVHTMVAAHVEIVNDKEEQ